MRFIVLCTSPCFVWLHPHTGQRCIDKGVSNPQSYWRKPVGGIVFCGSKEARGRFFCFGPVASAPLLHNLAS